jgi:hypothetical protein
MGLKKQRKVPAGPKQVPTKGKRFARSSTKQPKAQGIKAGQQAAYGILHGGNQSTEKLMAKAGRMFGNGSRNTPTGQSRLESKVKRQVY